MANLSVLDQPRTFPPKKILLIVWILSALIAIYGIIVTPGPSGVVLVWVAIAVVALWQIWTIRWVQVDAEGVRMRNIFRRGRELRWEEITDFHEEEVRLSKHPYVVLHLSNKGNVPEKRVTRIDLTSDQVGFETLRAIIREAIPKPVAEP